MPQHMSSPEAVPTDGIAGGAPSAYAGRTAVVCGGGCSHALRTVRAMNVLEQVYPNHVIREFEAAVGSSEEKKATAESRRLK